MVQFQYVEHLNPDLIFTDGGTIGGSPGNAIYYSMKDPTGFIHRYSSENYSRASAAEASGLLAALSWVESQGNPSTPYTIYLDSRTLVSRVNGHCDPERGHPLERKALQLFHLLQLRGFRIRIDWSPRETLESELGH